MAETIDHKAQLQKAREAFDSANFLITLVVQHAVELKDSIEKFEAATAEAMAASDPYGRHARDKVRGTLQNYHRSFVNLKNLADLVDEAAKRVDLVKAVQTAHGESFRILNSVAEVKATEVVR